MTFLLSVSMVSCLVDENIPIKDQVEYLDFDSSITKASQLSVIQEAASRMDKFVKYKEGRFVVDHCSPTQLGLSANVFNYMLQLVDQQNEELSNFSELSQVSPNTFQCNSIIPNIRLKLKSEEAGGGISTCIVEVSWYATYIYIYISNDSLRYSTYLLGAASAIASQSPEPFVSKTVAAACALASIACTAIRDEYPRGIIISLVKPAIINGCIPYSLSSQ